jgi:hypothetical protein
MDPSLNDNSLQPSEFWQNSPCGYSASGVIANSYFNLARPLLNPEAVFTEETRFDQPFNIQLTNANGEILHPVRDAYSARKTIVVSEDQKLAVVYRTSANPLYECYLPLVKKKLAVNAEGSFYWLKSFIAAYPQASVTQNAGTAGSVSYNSNVDAAVAVVFDSSGKAVLIGKSSNGELMVLRTMPAIDGYLRRIFRDQNPETQPQHRFEKALDRLNSLKSDAEAMFGAQSSALAQ